MRQKNNPLILIIDDEEAILQTLKDALTDESYRVQTLSQADKALEMVGKLIPDIVLLDIFMPHYNGLKLLAQMKKEFPDQKVIIISGFGTIPIAIEAIEKGALDFIEKPLNLDEILNKIEFLKEKSGLNPTATARVSPGEATPPANPYHVDNDLLRTCNIVGQSHLFLELIEQGERLAPHPFPILIYGEQGTGKTTLALYIHKKGISEKAPGDQGVNTEDTTDLFEVVNCDALLEKESVERLTACLSTDKPKTLFLKQIETLSPASQKVLLSFLEQSEERLSGRLSGKLSRSSIRLIASSDPSLFHIMQRGSFNRSLFCLLNKAPIEVPPLRKRPYDIPLLINYYLSYYNAKHNSRVVLTTQSIRLLRNRKWPGNIRDLRQAIENLIIHADRHHQVITPKDLTTTLGERSVEFIEEQSLSRFDSLDQATTAFKKSFLLYLLRNNHYSVDQVSSRLNLSPLQLKHLLLELNIEVTETVS